MNSMVRGIGALAVVAVLAWSRPADACGCLAPPTPAEPIVQAGERILFAVRNGVVTAHIQVQYAGDAKDFGWLLPLPSVPTLTVGSDELFTQLDAATRPTFLLNRTFTGKGGPPPPLSLSCSRNSPTLIDRTADARDGGASSPLVTTSSVGPYQYAVLRADDQAAMFQWLSDNRYFVPAGTGSVVTPYIHPGAYFLALKLKAGANTGDITPVVLQYPSSLPMIPLILTSVGAQPNMGVQVFLLGNGRGIPRNYHHVVINDALLDWQGGAKNYGALVTQAVSEAPQKHAFVTEYSGPSAVMHDVLGPPQRLGTEEELKVASTPAQFVRQLFQANFADPRTTPPLLPANVIKLLLAQVPLPDALVAQGITANAYLSNLDYYLGTYRDSHPSEFANVTIAFDAPVLARQIFDSFVKPVRETNALFDEFPTLTRLFTTLSPQDMTSDPVFSFNPALPLVKREHTASLETGCTESKLVTEQGWVTQGSDTVGTPLRTAAPAALRVEVLSEEGQPTIVTDNTATVRDAFSASASPRTGCSVVDPLSLGIFAMMTGLFRRRARR